MDTTPLATEETKYLIVIDRDYNNEVVLGIANTLEEAIVKREEIENIRIAYRKNNNQEKTYLCEHFASSTAGSTIYINLQKYRNGVTVSEEHNITNIKK